MTNRTSRLAPSPTGALHLGNARTFLVNWALARREGWRLLMRIEDLDGPRVKPEAARDAIDTLSWLGLDYDGDVTFQSRDLERYRHTMRDLAGVGRVYACALTRREIAEATRAPHATPALRSPHAPPASDRSIPFPVALRPEDATRSFDAEDTNYRFRVDDETVEVFDQVRGPVLGHPLRDSGDFVVWTKRGVPAYQLAVVVDDAEQDVTDVVRGEDLLPSAVLQTLLYRAVGRPVPRWWHLPLVVGPDGRRLAKRHGDTRVQTYREAGVSPDRVIGLLAFWCGVLPERESCTANDFRDGLRLDRLSGDPVVFTEDDHAWLLDRSQGQTPDAKGPAPGAPGP